MSTRSAQMDAAKSKMKARANARGNAKPEELPKPAAKLTDTVAFYDHSRGGYWTRNHKQDWIQFTESALKRRLRLELYNDVAEKEIQMTRIDRHLLRLQLENDVIWAGPLAGYRPGIHEVCGQRILVTEGPRLLAWNNGTFGTIRHFVESLLGENAPVFYAWLKCGLKTLYAGPPFRPGQMLAIAGPAGCGKSLLQNLITVMLGGRSAKPYRYMIGDTSFNSDLFQNEHLMIEDEAASTDLRIRRHFGSQLKNMIANEVQSLHRKGRDALSISPFWRVTITLNDEPENLMVLPPLDESLRDKITILRASKAKFPYGPDDLAARNKYYASIVDELPGFIFFLRGYRIPDRWLNQRYGVEAFQDADLLRELEDLAPESRLLTLIDTLYIWGIDRQPWSGTSVELEDVLLEKDKLGRVQKLLSYNTACGVYLARLKNRCPERVTETRDGRHSRKWCIKPPDR